MPRRLITTIKAFIYSDHRNEKRAKSLKVNGLIRPLVICLGLEVRKRSKHDDVLISEVTIQGRK